MYQKDRIRLIFIAVIIAIIGITYWLSGDKEVSGYVALGGLLVWLGVIYFLRRESD